MKNIMLTIFTILVSQILLITPIICDTPQEVFTDIYQRGVWGRNQNGEGTSGGGSTLESTEVYRKFLQQFLSEYNIKTVVDAGCGDWGFSHLIDWSGIDYIGYDVVKNVIKNNQKKFNKENIQFITRNFINKQLPSTDLLICKEVLQHLTLEDISTFSTQFHNFKYCLITNDIDPVTMTAPNIQINRGSYRVIDLTQPPFSLEGYKILTYQADNCLKQVLLISNIQIE